MADWEIKNRRGLLPVTRGRECFAGSRLGHGHGHDIHHEAKTNTWHFSDDGTPFTSENERPCKLCGGDPKQHGGADPCFGKLPGVRNACCGHGIEKAYIQFENGVLIEGDFRIYNGPVKRPKPVAVPKS